MPDRIQATAHLTARQCLDALDKLKFACASLIQPIGEGSYARENAENAVKGIDHRIDFLHDSLRRLLGPAATGAASQEQGHER